MSNLRGRLNRVERRTSKSKVRLVVCDCEETLKKKLELRSQICSGDGEVIFVVTGVPDQKPS